MTRLFLPQGILETWALSDQADVRDGALSIQGEPAGYPVSEAYHVRQLVSGPDEHGLLEKVKTPAQLEALGVEIMGSSLIAGESAYEAEQGYTVEVEQAETVPETGQKNDGQDDLLAAFLLNKL